MNKLGLGALGLAAVLAGKMLSGSKDGEKAQQKTSALDEWDALNDKIDRDTKTFDEWDAYADKLDREEKGETHRTDSESNGDSVFLRAAKWMNKEGKRIKKENMRNDCDRMERLEKTMDEDFDQIQRDYGRNFPKMDKW